MSRNRDVATLRAELKADGLSTRLARGHWIVELPDGRFVWTIPSTPSDPRALLNCRTLIRRRLRELRYQPSARPGGRSKRSISSTEGTP